MSDDVLTALRDLAARGLSDEDTARALLDLTLQAAPPEVADAVRVCALPAWFDADLLALLSRPLSPADEEPEGEHSFPSRGEKLGESQPLPPHREEPEESQPLPPHRGELEGGQPLPPHRGELEGGSLLERVAAFSFVMPRQGGGYVYHEATRARLLDWWRKPENRPRFAALSDRLARHYLALARKQVPRLTGPAYLETLAALDGVYPNIRAAWEMAVELENWAMVQSFAYALADYQMKRGLWADWIAWTQAGLEACKRMSDEAGTATMQNNLGNAYVSLPTGDRAANLARAIQCYQEALRFYTPETTPLDYAMTQNNLGLAYSDLPTGERVANLRQAIECYEQALTVYTAEAAPLDYAMTQNNLGAAYADLPTGERAANLARAIECYQQALRFRTPEATPLDYAMTQNNLGLAYLHLPTGDRATNLKQALECAETALQVKGLALWDQAEYLFTRGLVHLALGHLDQALADYQAAVPLADAITVAEARKELERFAAAHPDTPGLDAVRALLT